MLSTQGVSASMHQVKSRSRRVNERGEEQGLRTTVAQEGDVDVVYEGNEPEAVR